MEKVYIFIAIVLMINLFSCLTSQEQNFKGSDKNKELTSNYSNLGNYFEDMQGCAVIFDKQNNRYYFHNKDMATIRVSPYSTFKILATLIGLQNDIIKD